MTSARAAAPARAGWGSLDYTKVILRLHSNDTSRIAASAVQAIEVLARTIADQLPHLDAEDHLRAVYAGRYVDGAWRDVEHQVDRWVSAVAAEPGMPSDDRRDVGEVLIAAGDAPPLASGSVQTDGREAAAHLRAVAALVSRIERALEDGDGHEVCIAAHLMRRSFSAYRVVKYRWLEDAVEDGRFTPVSGYDWMEF